MPNFNSNMVRLKVKRGKDILQSYFNFNSNMVRLKASANTSSQSASSFQFQYGSIKRQPKY